MRPITLRLDRPRRLRFTYQSRQLLCNYFEAGDHKVGALLNDIDKRDPDPRRLAVLLWSGMVWDDPKLTPSYLEDVLTLMTPTHRRVYLWSATVGLKLMERDLNKAERMRRRLMARLDYLKRWAVERGLVPSHEDNSKA